MNTRLKEGLRRLLPRSIGPRRILGGPLRGNVLVTSWHDYPAAILGRTERGLLDWFEANVCQGETWLDIGAHYGYTSLALSRLVGQTGRVYSFEPFLPSSGHLCQTRRLNRLRQMRIIPIALGNGRQLGVNYMSQVRGMLDSLLSDGNPSELYLEAPLDWLWPIISERDSRIDGLKIDVQGMEIPVLQGMRETLAHWRPKLALEFHGGVNRAMVFQLLTEAGYRLPGAPIEPVPGEQNEPEYLDNRSYAFTTV